MRRLKVGRILRSQMITGILAVRRRTMTRWTAANLRNQSAEETRLNKQAENKGGKSTHRSSVLPEYEDEAKPLFAKI